MVSLGLHDEEKMCTRGRRGPGNGMGGHQKRAFSLTFTFSLFPLSLCCNGMRWEREVAAGLGSVCPHHTHRERDGREREHNSRERMRENESG